MVLSQTTTTNFLTTTTRTLDLFLFILHNISAAAAAAAMSFFETFEAVTDVVVKYLTGVTHVVTLGERDESLQGLDNGGEEESGKSGVGYPAPTRERPHPRPSGDRCVSLETRCPRDLLDPLTRLVERRPEPTGGETPAAPAQSRHQNHTTTTATATANSHGRLARYHAKSASDLGGRLTF
ncbi:hypothetical protein FMEXI_2101 [Fusarium mexicanum]|uniref:Uncharacterized protein n=1 Tax=Fusarium mexicanum TaxID=751941 RepID=A0A8H5JFY8_9HYPO|nr:hypothetical protein FMEXI_2101 [Fusarium mexicanum]